MSPTDTRHAAYERLVRPLLQQVFDICAEEKLAFVASVCTGEPGADNPVIRTTVRLGDGCATPDTFYMVTAILTNHPEITAIVDRTLQQELLLRAMPPVGGVQ